MPPSSLIRRVAGGEDVRLRRLLLANLGQRDTDELLRGTGNPKNLTDLAFRVSRSIPDPNRLRRRPQNIKAGDVGRGLAALERSGVDFRASPAPGPRPISGVIPISGPVRQGTGTGGQRDIEGRIGLAAAREAGARADIAQARAGQERAAPRTPLDAARQQAAVEGFRGRRDVGVTRGPRGRPRIREEGITELRQQAERAQDPSFEDAQRARRADLFAGVGGASPAISTALINQERDRARFESQAELQQLQQQFQADLAQFKAQGLNERQANQLASQNMLAQVRVLAGLAATTSLARDRNLVGGIAGIGQRFDEPVEESIGLARERALGVPTDPSQLLAPTGTFPSPGTVTDNQARADLAAEGFTPEEIELFLQDPESRAELGLR